MGSVQKTTAQYYFYDNYSYDTPLMFEFGGSFGIMNCLTDLGGKAGIGKPFVKDLNIGNTQINGSLYLGMLYRNVFGLRLEGTFGTIKAYDSILASVKSTTGGRYERNLSFKSKISEISLIAEFHPLYAFINWEDRDEDPPRLSPYVAAGIGFFSFNPQAEYKGQYIDLQPLSTEGQGFANYPDRKPYKLSQKSYPIGLGVKYELASNLNVRAEFMYRILSTDYLDDVSSRYVSQQSIYDHYTLGGGDPRLLDAALAMNDRRNPFAIRVNPNGGQIRGNPKDNDAYFTFNLKLGLTFGRESIRR